MNVAGFVAATLVGISLGIMGGGGSILTLPVLLYLFHLDAVASVTWSLFIVGTTSFTGAIAYFSKGLVSVRTAIIISLPSLLSVVVTRKILLPVIPGIIFTIENFSLRKEIFLLIIFSILMIVASYTMIRKNRRNKNSSLQHPPAIHKIIIQGIAVGIVTGLVGAGGGFLIIPLLVNGLQLPMKTAVGTSLLIIAINSLTGFLFSSGLLAIAWPLLLGITAFALLGSVIGTIISGRINEKLLKPAFGWFILAMGIYIIFKETLFH